MVDTNVTCAVTIAPVNTHQLPFYFTSATGGLQEAINQNLTTPQTNTIILDSTFYQLVGGATNAAAVIAAAKGSINTGPGGRNPGADGLVPVEWLTVCRGQARATSGGEHAGQRHVLERPQQRVAGSF